MNEIKKSYLRSAVSVGTVYLLAASAVLTVDVVTAATGWHIFAVMVVLAPVFVLGTLGCYFLWQFFLQEAAYRTQVRRHELMMKGRK